VLGIFYWNVVVWGSPCIEMVIEWCGKRDQTAVRSNLFISVNLFLFLNSFTSGASSPE
jgi:hypothetical protein